MTIESTLDRTNGLIDQAERAVDGAVASTTQSATHAVEELASAAHRFHNDLAPVLSQAAERAASLAQRGADGAREASQQLRTRAEALSTSTAQYIQEQPLRSVLIAAATGAVAAAIVALLRSPRSRR